MEMTTKRFCINKNFSVLAFFIFLTSCVSGYQPYNNSKSKPLGYISIKLKVSIDHQAEQYLLTYYGDGSKEQNYKDWLTRASELCPDGYEIRNHEEDKFYGSIRTPVNGMMVTLGTQQPIDRGLITCITKAIK